MEKRDLYDENRILTGETVFKGDPIPLGKFIIVVLSIIQNSRGEFLIQKRSVQKNGKYASTGGHVKSGETSIEGIISEIKEEIGLDVKEDELELIYTDREVHEQVFFDVYYLKKDFDICDLVLQKDEVELVEWASLDKIKQLLSDGLFAENHAEEFFRVIDIFKKHGRAIL